MRETLYMTRRDDWRAWLEKNHKRKKEIWLIYYKKSSGKSRISYDDSVEEAICFGWIDSTVKKIDDEKFAQRFTPRKKTSVWSKLNKMRVRKMMKAGKMKQAGLEAFGRTGSNQRALIAAENLKPPSDMKNALMADAKAWQNFQNFPPTARKLYIWWVAMAKRPETRDKRIKETVKRCSMNKRLY